MLIGLRDLGINLSLLYSPQLTSDAVINLAPYILLFIQQLREK